MSVADTYSRSARSWATGAGLVYVPLAEALIDLVDDDLSGRAALDVGAGTGAATIALAARGADVVATDLSYGMLREARSVCGRIAVGDVLTLPFAADAPLLERDRFGLLDAVPAGIRFSSPVR